MHTAPLLLPPPFIGDLSTQDASVLATMATGRAVLEFGAGGSTQIFAATARHVVSMETDGDWILRTQRNLERLAPGRSVHFLHYDPPSLAGTGPFDLIFVDGESSRRIEFASSAFSELAQAGLMVFHDGRTGERDRVLQFACAHAQQLGEIVFDVGGSNMIALRKREMPAYVNWNVAEGRAPWEVGSDEPSIPPDFLQTIAARLDRFFIPSVIPVPGEQP